MDRNVYLDSEAKIEETKADKMLELLYLWYIKNSDKLPPFYMSLLDNYPVSTVVCDYIASMTDRFAVKVFEDIYLPLNWNKL